MDSPLDVHEAFPSFPLLTLMDFSEALSCLGSQFSHL